MPALDVAGEFETIERLLRPLAHPEWGRGLADDVAVLPSRPGYDLVLTKDALVEGVHFLPDDPLETVAQKLLRVNLSDLAAKGAEPFGYLLACAWSERCGWPEREAFAAGLAEDQGRFGVFLMGGDTVKTPGPAIFSLTALGWVPEGEAVSRDGAQVGDLVFVTGTIGDGLLGLRAARGQLAMEPARLDALVAHYRTPAPQVGFAEVVRALATASADVSDGLAADLAHICRASGVGADIELSVLPLSAAAQAWIEDRVDPQDALIALATGGDDYQIVFTAPAEQEERLRLEARRRLIRLTRIGEVTAGDGLVVRYGGQIAPLVRSGWTHD
ncbi:MAG: thiamine-phosphate kinase [Caulobacterales bacterium RIFOXYB1_FULL_67_16]|nr:MAG: thiamine-phosphate kinase [Caulobacterales bacterium RIFOXYB1_FULL_67_16]